MKCTLATYCSPDCQKADWPAHKKTCKAPEDVDALLRKSSSSLNMDDFEVIRCIGEGNFTQIYLVEHKVYKKRYALKLAMKKKLQQMRKELDILQEKHSLFKVADAFAAAADTPHSPAVKLVATFSDEVNVYLLMEMLEGKELWTYTRTFGVGSPA